MTDIALPDAAALWAGARERLIGHLSDVAQRTWLAETVPVGCDGETLVLAAPHSFAREQLDNRYAGLVRAALAQAAGRHLKVVVTIRTRLDAEPDRSDAEPLPEVPPLPAAGQGHASALLGDPATRGDLHDRYTFDRFVVGPSNHFPWAAAFAVAETPAQSYNPLFIFGGPGLGKTHLLQAVGHYTRSLYPHLRVRYVSAEQFTNEFIDAVLHGRQSSFQRRYRDVDVLLVDDIQFLENKERSKEEFFHTFNALHQASRQIVISSDRAPKDIKQLEERLRTRFEMGLVADVKPPELETRIAILRRRAEQDGLEVPAEVLQLIAERITRNVRELEGALNRVAAHASINRIAVTSQSAEDAMAELFPEEARSPTSVAMILEETAAYYGFSVEELCSTSRTRTLVNARQIAMYLTRELTDLSLPRIGKAFGGRDHSTVLHALGKITKLMRERPQTHQQLRELTARITARASGPR